MTSVLFKKRTSLLTIIKKITKEIMIQINCLVKNASDCVKELMVTNPAPNIGNNAVRSHQSTVVRNVCHIYANQMVY